MLRRAVREIVAQLVLLLVAGDGKGSDRGNKGVVSEGVPPGDRARGDREGEIECEAVVLVADLGAVQDTGIEGKRPEPSGREFKLITENEVVVNRAGGCAG